MEDLCSVVDSAQCSQYIADNFLCNLLKVYTVASLGYFLFLTGSRITDSVEQGPMFDDEESESEPEPEPDILYPIEEANHDVAATTDGAFCIDHYDPGDGVSEYIVMMYSSESSAFVYWCNSTPKWDVLQTTARKFVTENRCAGLYAVQSMVTDTEETESTTESDDGKTLSTRVDNVHVRQGRLDRFRTLEQAAAKHAEVDYKIFATMRRRAGFATSN